MIHGFSSTKNGLTTFCIFSGTLNPVINICGETLLGYFYNCLDNAANDVPGPIDNKPLFDENGLDIKKHLFEQLDYVLVPEDAWYMLVDKGRWKTSLTVC